MNPLFLALTIAGALFCAGGTIYTAAAAPGGLSEVAWWRWPALVGYSLLAGLIGAFVVSVLIAIPWLGFAAGVALGWGLFKHWTGMRARDVVALVVAK